MRTENDSIGDLQIPDNAAYGIHALRAKENFINSGEKIHPYLIKAYLLVKKAAAITNSKIGLIEQEISEAIIDSIDDLLKETEETIKNRGASIYENIIVDPLQGGAGTSLNMNLNEVIANYSLKKLDYNYGDYSVIHPLDHINLSQSTNDTFPTALKIASVFLLKELQESYVYLQKVLQQKEVEFKGIIKLARTQYQDAVPITLGQEFAAYAQAIARDRWRLYNAEERLRSVNLGGTAVGNSITADNKYVLEVNNVLRRLTGIPIAKAEDLIDATQNLDVFVEVHGLVKAGAVSVQKMCNDLRFLSSGPFGGIGEIFIPQRQAGSSIMPGKVNPVILENTIQICELVKGNDVVITNLAANGNLELNAFTPMLAHLFLKSLSLLTRSNYNLCDYCIAGIKANAERCKQNLISSSAVAAALIPKFGYDKIEIIAKQSYLNKRTFMEELLASELIDENELLKILSKEIGIEIE
ncbi:MAG: aspartate ammonia-lyase [Bacteroidetes bacterium]|nr:aspartate ammonia-lyase [Bacteroidota bacterium]